MKKLFQLLENLDDYEVFGKTDLEIASVADDSRKVKKGSLFIAIPGAKVDAHKFIPDCIDKGAAAVVGEKKPKRDWLKKITYVKVQNSRKALSLISSSLYGNPSKKLKMIGVTGTDGKTTTANFIYQILKSSGKKAGLISTVSAKIGDEEFDTGFHVTNPEPLELYKFLKKMVDDDCEYAVMEVTSHGLDQERVAGIEFEVGVLTNITSEHLDYHKNFENYLKTKAKLFLQSKTAVLNRDDGSFKKLLEIISKNTKVVGYAAKNDADYKSVNINLENGIKFDLISKKRKLQIKTAIEGGFNVYNLLAAISVSRIVGVSFEEIKKAVLSAQMPEGRFQEIKNDKGIKIIIDYAHTPNAVENALKTFEKEGRKIISIVSAEGERDPGKRFDIPKVAVEFSDVVILNPIDPRSETLEDILKEMEKGAEKAGAQKVNEKWFNRMKQGVKKKIYIGFLDRGEAIYFAINKVARRGDVVLILGKGHEKGMDFGAKELPWSDVQAVKMALKGNIKKTSSA